MALKLNCPKHKRYNPARDGEGAIRGGCAQCQALWQAWLIALKWMLEAR
jgi:hypothetical protein